MFAQINAWLRNAVDSTTACIVNCVLAFGNIGLFVGWMAVGYRDPAPDISLNITILQAMVTMAIILLAILSFFGFQNIQEKASSAASEAASTAIEQRFGELHIAIRKIVREELASPQETGAAEPAAESREEEEDAHPVESDIPREDG